MSYDIRPATASDEPYLWDMLYYAANMADDGASSPEAAKTHPYLAAYVRDWGRPGDLGIIALAPTDQQAVGAAWLRLLMEPDHRYAAVGVNISELAIAVHPTVRGQGLGRRLLTQLLAMARMVYPAVVLSVREHNPARRLYERAGFTIIDTIVNRVGGESFVMLYTFRSVDDNATGAG